MSLRNKLKATKSTEPEGEGVPVSDAPQWSCGELPVTWDGDEMKKLKKRNLRDNLKRGAITKEVYLILLGLK